MQRRYVLIPGAGGNARYWSRVTPLLANHGHEVFPLDLPNWPGATLADQAEAIARAGTGAGDVVLVAQSMGGFSAPMACARLSVSHLFLINAMIPEPGETPGEWWTNTGQSEAMRRHDIEEGRDPDAGFDLETYFLHDLPPEVLDELTSGGDQEPAETLFSSIYDLPCWPLGMTGSSPTSSRLEWPRSASACLLKRSRAAIYVPWETPVHWQNGCFATLPTGANRPTSAFHAARSPRELPADNAIR